MPVRIPAGDFMMGNDESAESLAADYPQYDRERFQKLNDEAPVHRVRITRDFLLGKTEATVGQFRRLSSNPATLSNRNATGPAATATTATTIPPSRRAATPLRAATEVPRGATPDLRRTTSTR